jgi:hypothetical protein
MWDKGEIRALVQEGQTIQSRLERSTATPDDGALAKKFAQMLFHGNTRGAMRMLAEKSRGGVLALTSGVVKDFASKHPQNELPEPETLIQGTPPPDLDPIVFEAIHGKNIKAIALKTDGAPGVSQLDDITWHKMVSSFKQTSLELCNSVALMARRLATEYRDPAGLEAFLANRGIPLDKGGGAVRPIGVGEILRRIIGKAVLGVINGDVQKAAGPLQLCAGEAAGVEAGIHAMRELFGSLENDGVFLIDAANAFNRVNRAAVLWNVFLCPPLKYVLINTYRHPGRIFVCDNSKCVEFASREGTTQGCPLAMAMYAIALIPLVKELKPLAKQVWYADDATGADTITNLKIWFDKLLERGPLYGYFPQPKKCVLIVKAEKESLARETFQDTGVEITTIGKRHLGAALGSASFKKEFVQEKVEEWISQIKILSKFAITQPHAAFSAFTHCLQGRWTFVSRTVPGAGSLLAELEQAIREVFIPAIVGRSVSDDERKLLSFPARFGG